MPRFATIALCAALLIASFQASYTHLHVNNSTDHAKEHHLGQGLTFHTHVSDTTDGYDQLPRVQSEAGQEQNDSVFLTWAPKQPQTDYLLIALPGESTPLGTQDQGIYSPPSPDRHAHDPPLVSSSAPRAPPA